MFRVNVLGLIQVTQEVARDMQRAGRGHIINIASPSGQDCHAEICIYAATKFGAGILQRTSLGT